MLKNAVKKFAPYLVKVKRSHEEVTLMFNMELARTYRERADKHPNPLTRYGQLGFSQSDEDGLTKEFLKRLGVSRGTFIEFGVGTGIENNTLVLLAMGWQGVWFGGEELDFDVEKSSRLNFQKCWITKDNILELYQNGVAMRGVSEADVVSVDLDGNDLYFCEKLLANGVQPKLYIVEYNARFAPPVRFCIDYHESHTWELDDYYGASLQSFVDLFSRYGYSLICCNAATGVNAYFVKNEDMPFFPEVPSEVSDIYASPFFIMHSGFLMKKSMATYEMLIR